MGIVFFVNSSQSSLPSREFLMKRFALPVFLLFAATVITMSQPTAVTAQDVKAEFLHAWNAYKQYAWGHDALKPLSKKPHDWHAVSLLMTPVDAYDTMLLMGLGDQAAEAKQLIFDDLSFDHDIEVQAFEITIRLLAGLLSSYQMDGDKRFLSLAEDLAQRLLPVYDSPTGMPYRYVNLRTGKTRDSVNNRLENLVSSYAGLRAPENDFLFSAAQEVHHLTLHRIDHRFGTWEINLVDKRDDLQTRFNRQIEIRNRLCFNPLGGIHYKNRSFTCSERP